VGERLWEEKSSIWVMTRGGKRNPLRKKRDNSIIKEFFLIKGKIKEFPE
jgi:hypothetical protein